MFRWTALPGGGVAGMKEGTTHKFYGGQKDGQCEGENDAPELPVLWHTMRDIVGRFGGG
jgi:hypothetical protein